MDTLVALFGAEIAVATALAAVAVWAPRRVLPKAIAVGLAGVLMATAYVGFVELLGRPKPAGLEWFANRYGEARVIAVRLKEGEAIYLWLELEGDPRPRAYVLPWTLKRARELQEAMQEARTRGTGVRMRRPFAGQRERTDSMFYAAPRQPLPPKEEMGSE